MAILTIDGNKWGNTEHPETISRYNRQLCLELYKTGEASAEEKKDWEIHLIHLQLDYVITVARELKNITTPKTRITLSALPSEALIYFLKQIITNKNDHIISITLADLLLEPDEINVVKKLVAQLDSHIKIYEPANWLEDKLKNQEMTSSSPSSFHFFSTPKDQAMQLCKPFNTKNNSI